MSSLQHILAKINVFIRKYYTNRLIRGIILFMTLFVGIFLFFSLTEYYARLGITGRAVLFFGALVTITAMLVYYLFIPLSKLLKIGKTLSTEEAAAELSKRLPELKDKLLNVVDLKNKQTNEEDLQLLNAAIEQKAADLRVIDFGKAVNFKLNYKYLRYFILLAIVFAVLMVSNPAVITESTKRIIDYGTEYVQPSKVQMQLLNKSLKVKRGTDIEIQFQSLGQINPSEVILNFSGKKLKMRQLKDDPTIFSYTFQNLNNSFSFYIEAGDYVSKKYQIEVLNPPLITEFSISVNTPSYTGEPDTLYHNVGDITVPAGSYLTWNFSAVAADSLVFKKDSVQFSLKTNQSAFSYSARIINNLTYGIRPVNTHFSDENFINYSVTVIPDLFPQIAAEQKTDSTMMSLRYFRGYIQDDYGINRLVFRYRISMQQSGISGNEYTTVKVPVNNSPGRQEFFHSFDFTRLNLQADQTIEYFFEVFDNDMVRGSKSAKSQIFYYRMPSFEEQLAQFDKINESTQNSVSQAMNLAQEMNEAFKDYQKSSVDNSKEDWENKQFIQDMQTKQDRLQQMIDEAKKEIEKAKELAEMNKQDEELLKKLEELQKMTEELLTDEIKELMDEINKLAQQYDDKVMQELLKQQDEKFKDLDKMLDRNLELLKRFKIEQKTEQIANELNKLAEQTDKLSQETKEKNTSNDKLSEKQDQLEDKFDKLTEEYKKTQEENKELERPFKMENFEQDIQKVKEEFQKSKEMLQKGREKKASDSQKNSSDQMKQMAQQMQQMMQSNTMQMNSENLEQLKGIVQDLLSLSFEQEDNIKNLRRININDPKFSEYGVKQIQLQNDYEVVADSLYSLSKRMFTLSNVINRETEIIEKNFEFAIKNFREKKTVNVINGQIKIMQSFNNLALILSQLIEQMQNMQSSGSGSQQQMTENSKPSFDGLQQQQQDLKKQLEDMLQQMKEQGGKPGQHPTSKQLAEMLARQEIFRQKLEEMKSKHSLGQDTKKLLDEISDLSKKNEKQLMNRQITPELLERQKLIETRLLEAEQAENKRKTDPKRESKNPNEKKYESPEEFFKDDKSDSSVKENLNKNAIILNPYYRKVFDNYNNKINEK